ncbi:MAG: aspartate--tRNA ligase [Puniceicoccales bacterium]|jgi:aspartyl-tRNA synthetase|nr:aspartate--tRNA ligase [Puniceicoccales bacterium]
MRRTHHCSALTKKDVGKSVHLIGWIQSIRDHGGLIFVDLRDREGITQIVLDPKNDAYAPLLPTFKDESVIEISGTVRLRPDDTANSHIATGEIEIIADALKICNIANTLPFPLEDSKADKVNEDLRFTYRYLDLRRPKNLRALRTRHRIAHTVRNYLDHQDFIEVELPYLFKTTPEGAREFLVPSRQNPGSFYALSQSPQQYKQMLMVAGIERYYSLARCFRDEDLRADRQQEFTQIDLEMSFIDREDIYALIEGMMKIVFKEALNRDIETPFIRMSFREVMDRFGSDKPDTRFALELVDLSSVFKHSEFKIFRDCLEKGGSIKAINGKQLTDITQGELKNLEDIAKTLGAKGLAFIKYEKGEWKSPILKFLSAEEKDALQEILRIEDGDIVFFAASEWLHACTILGRIRLECAHLLVNRGHLSIPRDQFNFLWVVDFPLISFDENQGRYVSTHHPFTAPVEEDEEKLKTDPLHVRAQHYDIVLNGFEIGGGSIRIHNSELQSLVMRNVLNLDETTIRDRFGYMLRAFRFGAPPHGGIAIGLDRLTAIICGTDSIRDVIAFPKTQKGQDLMAQSPSYASEKQLRELHIATVTPKEK